MNNIAFVYHYWNIKDFTSYYGYKERWNHKKYSPYDIFVEHPLGEKSTSTHYCSSCRQKEWKEACKRGEIYGEIIAVFTGKNAGELAHELEHQMIVNHKAVFGQETLYNRHDANRNFSTEGMDMSVFWTTEKRNTQADISRELWKTQEYRDNMPDRHGKNNGMYGKGDKVKGEKNGRYGDHWSDEYKQLFSEIKTIWVCPIKLAYLRNHKLMDIKDIAKEFGVAKSTISKNIAKYNLPKTNKKCYKYISLNKDELYDLYINQKLSYREIAIILNVSKCTVGRKLKEYGII